MLPILVVPEQWGYDVPLGSSDIHDTLAHRRLSHRPRPVKHDKRARRQFFTIRAAPPTGHANNAAPSSLADCERLLKLLLKRKRDTMPDSVQHEIQRIRTMTPMTRVPSSVLSRRSAAWLLWSMSWRGVSTAQHLFTDALHPPTLLVAWLSRMPTWLRFGPAGPLLRALHHVVEQTYLVWHSLTAHLRASRSYRLSLSGVTIRFLAARKG